jgi:hypothetical protein
MLEWGSVQDSQVTAKSWAWSLDATSQVKRYPHVFTRYREYMYPQCITLILFIGL